MKKILILSLLLVLSVAQAATTTLTQNPQRITVSGTSENDINFDNLLNNDANYGYALIDWVSGTAVQLNSNDVTIDSNTATLSSGNPKMILFIKRGVKIRFKGGAGGEVFQIIIHSK